MAEIWDLSSSDSDLEWEREYPGGYHLDDSDMDEDEERYKRDHNSEKRNMKSYFVEKEKKTSSLRDKHQEFYSRMNEFCSSEKYTDVRIVCGNNTFKCHRVVLAAASDYFDKMFSSGLRESNSEEVFLKNIDAAAFEQILIYAYHGKITIQSMNVYSLLCASEMLGLNYIEDVCIEYLVERDIPLNYAPQIFKFAHRTRKNHLVRATSQLLIKNLDIFSSNSDFLQFSFDELESLLENCPSLSSKTENLVLGTLLQWVSYSNCSLQDKRRNFLVITQSTQLQNLLPTQLEEYFDKNFIHESHEVDLSLDIESRVKKSTIYVYAKRSCSRKSSDTYLIKMQENNVNLDPKEVNWNFSPIAESPNICEMKTVVFDDRFYCLKSFRDEKWVKSETFTVSSSVDLSSDSLLLTLPPNLNSHCSPNLYCSMDNIYLYNYCHYLHLGEQLYVYLHELDEWSSISLNRKQMTTYPSVVCDMDRLYLIGGYGNIANHIRPKTRCLQSYDHRVGKLEQLPDSRLTHNSNDNGCIHKGKLYIPSFGRTFSRNYLFFEIYDIVAGKWDAIKVEDYNDRGPCGLHSFNNELYAFYELPTLLMRKYDSFTQEWCDSMHITPAIESQVSSIKNDGPEWRIFSTLVF